MFRLLKPLIRQERVAIIYVAFSLLTLPLDDKLFINNKLVTCVSQSTYLELCRIYQLDVSPQLRLPKPLSHPWYCHVVTYCNSPTQQLFEKLQKVQNCSARLIFKTSKRTHASPLLNKLHWLQIAQRIEYKVSSMCYDVV